MAQAGSPKQLRSLSEWQKTRGAESKDGASEIPKACLQVIATTNSPQGILPAQFQQVGLLCFPFPVTTSGSQPGPGQGFEGHFETNMLGFEVGGCKEHRARCQQHWLLCFGREAPRQLNQHPEGAWGIWLRSLCGSTLICKMGDKGWKIERRLAGGTFSILSQEVVCDSDTKVLSNLYWGQTVAFRFQAKPKVQEWRL